MICFLPLGFSLPRGRNMYNVAVSFGTQPPQPDLQGLNLYLIVSVTDPETGAPVTGLIQGQFNICLLSFEGETSTPFVTAISTFNFVELAKGTGQYSGLGVFQGQLLGLLGLEILPNGLPSGSNAFGVSLIATGVRRLQNDVLGVGVGTYVNVGG
jgi:hypothetical protein